MKEHFVKEKNSLERKRTVSERKEHLEKKKSSLEKKRTASERKEHFGKERTVIVIRGRMSISV